MHNSQFSNSVYDWYKHLKKPSHIFRDKSILDKFKKKKHRRNCIAGMHKLLFPLSIKAGSFLFKIENAVRLVVIAFHGWNFFGFCHSNSVHYFLLSTTSLVHFPQNNMSQNPIMNSEVKSSFWRNLLKWVNISWDCFLFNSFRFHLLHIIIEFTSKTHLEKKINEFSATS